MTKNCELSKVLVGSTLVKKVKVIMSQCIPQWINGKKLQLQTTATLQILQNDEEVLN